MKTSNIIERIIVDANPIISALIKGAATRVFWSRKIKEFITTEFTVNEVRSYVPFLAHKAKTNEETIVLDFHPPCRDYTIYDIIYQLCGGVLRAAGSRPIQDTHKAIDIVLDHLDSHVTSLRGM